MCVLKTKIASCVCRKTENSYYYIFSEGNERVGNSECKQIENTYLGIKVIGHNEISTKDCPGFNVQEWLNGRN